MHYTAVVVGLGPAGASALRRLHELGVDAVGFDRRHELEEPTICGEYLPEPGDISFIADKPSVSRAYSYIARAGREKSLGRIVLEVEGVRRFNLGVRGFTVSRKKLAGRLVEGLEYHLSSPLKSIRRVGGEYVVRAGGVEVTARYVVAADGYPSATRRLLGLPYMLPESEVALGVNVRARAPAAGSDVYMLVSKETSGGYAWVIPFSGDVANVGVGVRADSLAGFNPRRAVEWLLERNPGGLLEGAELLGEPRGRWIPVSGFYGEPSRGGVLFAGDSLGAVNPVNGGGIFSAMALGILAAESVWLGNPGLYGPRAWSEVGWVLEVGRRYRRVVDFLYDHWLLGGLMLRLVPSALMERVVKGEETPLAGLLGIGMRRYGLSPRGLSSRTSP